MKKCFAKILSIVLVTSLVSSCFSIISFSDEDIVKIPEPIKVVDFSKSFEELVAEDDHFEVVENSASPKLIKDEEMGQVLQLGKTLIKGREFFNSTLISDESEYSKIKLTNPYVGLDYLKEYEPYEDVQTIEYKSWDSDKMHEQPYWEDGITISYWIKSPNSVNSNVLGFTSERFQIQVDDYANYLATVRFDKEYDSMTDSEREEVGVGPSGVLPDSDFYFDYLRDENGEALTYMDEPVYIDRDKMGKYFWLNKFYEPGYVLMDDGTYEEATFKSGNYEIYSVFPYLGKTKEDHNPGESMLRYGWIYSEMWLDASSSFYYTQDLNSAIQLNPNHVTSYNTKVSIERNNSFSINSWKGCNTFEEAVEKNKVAPSPMSQPDQWHNVTVIIQNDWVRYYLDGVEIDIQDNYSAFGFETLWDNRMSSQPWAFFNKGTGTRYGYGVNTSYLGFDAGYVSTTIMEWLTMDCTEMTIGGGNVFGDGYYMYADTDEILLKNVVFYDCMLSDEQIKALSDNPFIYHDGIFGDINEDEKINAEDALIVLKYAARIEELAERQLIYADVAKDEKINAEDALEILKYAAILIRDFN